MNNDLISRRALKKALEEDMKYGGVKTDEFDKGYDLGIKTAIEMLDNAPPITDHSRELVQKSIEIGRRVGYFEGKIENKRPQGEWIDYDNTFYKCPDCGYLLEKCCPHCQNKVILPSGAKMDGGEE